MRDNNLASEKREDSVACKWCGEFVPPFKFHEEFDFFLHPNAKTMLRDLHQKAHSLHITDMDEYAVWRKLRSEHGVVMPAYARLVNAWKWMVKLVEHEKTAPRTTVTDLPL